MATEVESALTNTPSDATKVFPPPLSLLDRLDHMLGINGSIRSPKDVPEFVKVMQLSQFLVSRCIILNVLKSTKTQSVLEEVMQAGGWNILNMWLAEAKKAQNIALLVELLQVLQKLPVTVNALKQGNMGKLIKQLSKAENPEVKSLASDILTKWMAIFRGQPTPTAITTDERRTSASEEDTSKISKPKKEKADKKSSSKKKESKSKPLPTPPVESQPPPGPMVALGKPKDKLVKRQRDHTLLKSVQPPPEKKIKGNGSKGLMESEGFMAFLSNQAATKQKEKKVKKIPKMSKISRTNSVTSDTNEPKQEVTTPTIDSPTLPTAEEMEEEPSSGDGSKKKKVSWAAEGELTIVHYFELDESERVNVNRTGNFLAAAQQEKRREREALEMFSRDRLAESIGWQRPPLIELPPDMVHPRGQNSEERQRQMERETKVLAQLFLSKSSVQPSPMEPDPEPSIPDQEPKLIPLNEPGAPPNQPPPVFPPPTLPLPVPHGPIEPPLMSPGTTINQAQSLINYMENNQSSEPMLRGNGQFTGPPQPPPPPGAFYPAGPMRGGPPGEFRGGFRRRFPPTGLESKICKHFLTHGCRMGNKCRFLHCTPEELANQISHDQMPPMRGFRGRGRPWGRGGRPPLNPGPPPKPEINSEQMDTSQGPYNNSSESLAGPVSTS